MIPCEDGKVKAGAFCGGTASAASDAAASRQAYGT